MPMNSVERGLAFLQWLVSLSQRLALLIRGSWYAREVHRCAIDRRQHLGTSLRRVAEDLGSWMGRRVVGIDSPWAKLKDYHTAWAVCVNTETGWQMRSIRDNPDEQRPCVHWCETARLKDWFRSGVM